MSEYTTDLDNLQQDTEILLNEGAKEFSIPNGEYGYIYYLIDEVNGIDKIIYIGQTRDMYSRMNAHSKKKNFKKILYKEVPGNLLNEYEAYEILKYLPIENKTVPKNNHWYSLDEANSFHPFVYQKRVKFLNYIKTFGFSPLNGYYHIDWIEDIIKLMLQEE